MYCPFNICCHQYQISSCFEPHGILSHRLTLGPERKPSAVTFLHCSLSYDSNSGILSKGSLRLVYICLSPGIHTLLLTIHPVYISNYNSRSRYITKLVKHWSILSYFGFAPLFLLVSIALTVINTFSACLFDFHVGRINLGTFHAGFTSCCSGYSGSSIVLSCSITDSKSAAQSTSLWFGLSKSPFQWSQASVSEMLAGGLSLSLSTELQLILRIWRTFNTWVRSPGRSFADKGGGKRDISDNLNAAAQSCWKSDHDALTISSVSELCPMAVICLIGAQDFFRVAHRFWLPCHIPKKSWTLALLCNSLSSTSFFISESVSVFVESNSGSAPAKIP